MNIFFGANLFIACNHNLSIKSSHIRTSTQENINTLHAMRIIENLLHWSNHEYSPSLTSMNQFTKPSEADLIKTWNGMITFQFAPSDYTFTPPTHTPIHTHTHTYIHIHNEKYQDNYQACFLICFRY